MKRVLLNLLTGLSLMLLMPVVVLWVRSYWVVDTLRHDRLIVHSLDAGRQGARSVHAFVSAQTTHGRLTLFENRSVTWDPRPFQEGEPTRDSALARRVMLSHAPAAKSWAKNPPPVRGPLCWLGVEVVHSSRPPKLDGEPPTTTRWLILPLWLPAVFLAAPVAWTAAACVRGRWVRRRGEPRCAVCGYDLRATPARCPECGIEAASDGDPSLSPEAVEDLSGAQPPRGIRRLLASDGGTQ